MNEQLLFRFSTKISLLTHHPRISGNTRAPFKTISASWGPQKVVPPPTLTVLLKYDGWFYGVYILGSGLSQTAVTEKDTLDKPTAPGWLSVTSWQGFALYVLATSVIHEQLTHVYTVVCGGKERRRTIEFCGKISALIALRFITNLAPMRLAFWSGKKFCWKIIRYSTKLNHESNTKRLQID